MLVRYYLYYCARGRVHSRDANRFVYIIHIILYYLCLVFFSHFLFPSYPLFFFTFESWEKNDYWFIQTIFACARSVFPPENITLDTRIRPCFFWHLLRIFLRPYVNRRVQGLEKLILTLLHWFKFTNVLRLWRVDNIISSSMPHNVSTIPTQRQSINNDKFFIESNYWIKQKKTRTVILLGGRKGVFEKDGLMKKKPNALKNDDAILLLCGQERPQDKIPARYKNYLWYNNTYDVIMIKSTLKPQNIIINIYFVLKPPNSLWRIFYRL